jgi:hypothetical protein
MSKRTILFPLKQGSRTPEEFREAVRKVMADRGTASWTKVTQASDLPPIRIVADPPSKAPLPPSGSDEPDDR